jgi:hypothetical protein
MLFEPPLEVNMAQSDAARKLGPRSFFALLSNSYYNNPPSARVSCRCYNSYLSPLFTIIILFQPAIISAQYLSCAGCEECPPGEYSSDGSACVKCPAGTYSQIKGAAVCEGCPFNTFVDQRGSSSAASCLSCSVVSSNRVTVYTGAASRSECVCAAGALTGDSSCFCTINILNVLPIVYLWWLLCV